MGGKAGQALLHAGLVLVLFPGLCFLENRGFIHQFGQENLVMLFGAQRSRSCPGERSCESHSPPRPATRVGGEGEGLWGEGRALIRAAGEAGNSSKLCSTRASNQV